VAVVRGANGPVLSRTLLSELQKEKKVLEGAAERVEVRQFISIHYLLNNKWKKVLQESSYRFACGMKLCANRTIFYIGLNVHPTHENNPTD